MRITRMRQLLIEKPVLGVPLVGLYLLARLLWGRKSVALIGLSVVFSIFALSPFIRQDRKGQGSVRTTSIRRPLYSVTDLGIIGDMPECVATDINNKGQVVGWCSARYQETRAFLWQNGTMTDLGIPHGNRSKALALNDKGQVVGWSGNQEERDCLAYLWQNGRARALGTLPGYKFSVASGINKFGDISGWAFGSKQREDPWSSGFLLTKGKLIGFSDEWREVLPQGINDKKQIVGLLLFFDIYDAFIYDDGKVRELQSTVGRDSDASAINNQGAIVGGAWRPGDRNYALLWERGADGGVTDLGTLGGWATANDINDSNQIVGWSNTASHSNARAFLWQKGKMQNLQDLIPADSGWTLVCANAINNRGQIVGTGIINGKTHAFLLTPQ